MNRPSRISHIGVAMLLAAAPAPVAAQTLLGCTEYLTSTGAQIALDKPVFAPGVSTLTTGKRAALLPPHLEFEYRQEGGGSRAYFFISSDFNDAMQTSGTVHKLVNLEAEFIHKGKSLLTINANFLSFNYKEPLLLKTKAMVLALYQDPKGSFTLKLRPKQARPDYALATYTIPNALILNAIGTPVRCPANLVAR
jgi:hypothetical protein